MSSDKSTIKYLYENIIQDQIMCVEYLRQNNLLPTKDVNNIVCSKVNDDGIKCGGQLCEKETTRTNEKIKHISQSTYEKIVSCSRQECQASQSIQSRSKFFTYTDLNEKFQSNLSLTNIMELIWFWAQRIPVESVVQLTARSEQSIRDWYNLCTDVTVDQYYKRQKMGGPSRIVQINGFLYQRTHSYDRGNYDPDINAYVENSEDDTASSDNGENTNSNSDGNTDEDSENKAPLENNQQRFETPRLRLGPWIFGLCCVLDSNIECRFFIVQNMDKQTLLPIIKREVEIGTTIYSEQCLAYSTLNDHGFIHETVNHSLDMFEPNTGAHIETIKPLLKRINIKYNIKIRKGNPLIHRKLQEEWWRSCHPSPSQIFEEFLADLMATYEM
ncbi:ISXO2-like transposase domain [Cinara cedri]|uniref:ISXO2-like transposase domain n=1 Tax=Cinara cedri TaxID=506608 RepID=A0A5E4MGN7_9HEMI|nr:ISXO2-like transposase domain [Cinara cedri]